MSSSLFRKLRLFLPLLLLALTFAGCGSSSSGGGTGTVSLYLTDAPTTDFARVLITITKVEAIGDAGSLTLSDNTATFDLLSLRDVAAPLLTAANVPAGDYAKLRLTVSSVVLVPFEGGGDNVAARVPGGAIDIVASGPFRLGDGKVLTALIDIDASLSIHVVEAAGGGFDYIFRPVVFVNLDAPQSWGRRVRSYGPVKNVDPATGRFDLYTCQTGSWPAVLPGYPATNPPGYYGYDRTLPVDASGALIYDAYGALVGLSAIAEYEWVTVTGTPRVGPDSLDLDGDGNRTEEIVRLDAELISRRSDVEGRGASRTGVVTSVGPDGRFTLENIQPAWYDDYPHPVTVVSLPQYRVFGWWGGEKAWADIGVGDLVRVDGFYDNVAERIEASSVYWYSGQGTGETTGSGLECVIRSIDPADTSMIVAPTERSGATGLQAVRLMPPCGIVVITAYYTGYTAAMGIDLTDLQPGQTVMVHGWKAADGYVYAWNVSGWPSNEGLPPYPW